MNTNTDNKQLTDKDELLAEQFNNTINQVNQFLEESQLDLLSIGTTTCSETNYNDAKLNLASAPSKLSKAEKDYYTCQYGESGYDSYITSKLTNSATAIGKNITAKINELVLDIEYLNDTYIKTQSSYTYLGKLYEKYKEEEDELNEQIIEARVNTGDVTTNHRKTYYENKSYDNLNKWYWYFFWFYAIVLLLFIIMLFMYNTTFSITTKIFTILLFLLYPFVMTTIYLWLTKKINEIYEFFHLTL